MSLLGQGPYESLDFSPSNVALYVYGAVFQCYNRHFTPGNMVLAGAGVDHEELVRLGEKYFRGLETAEGGLAWPSSKAARVTESTYHGGESRIVIGAEKARDATVQGCV